MEENAFITLFKAINTKFKRGMNKLSHRISCDHNQYEDIYCCHTGLFMFKKCISCGKIKHF